MKEGRVYPVQEVSLASLAPLAAAAVFCGINMVKTWSQEPIFSGIYAVSILLMALTVIHAIFRNFASMRISQGALIVKNLVGERSIPLDGLRIRPFHGLIWHRVETNEKRLGLIPLVAGSAASALLLAELHSMGVKIDLKGWRMEKAPETGSLQQKWLSRRRSQARSAWRIAAASAITFFVICLIFGVWWLGLFLGLMMTGAVLAGFFDVFSAEKGSMVERPLSSELKDLSFEPGRVIGEDRIGQTWSEDLGAARLVLQVNPYGVQRLALFGKGSVLHPMTCWGPADGVEAWDRIRSAFLARGVPIVVEEVSG